MSFDSQAFSREATAPPSRIAPRHPWRGLVAMLVGAIASAAALAAGTGGAPVHGAKPQPLAQSNAANGSTVLRRAHFGHEHPPPEVRSTADWIARSGDHGGAPFLIVDKRNARLFVFSPDARMVAASAVLLGAARGDDSVPGIGERKISEIQPHERTTPAGRFVAERGRNLQGEDIVWIDYDAAVSMHRVRAKNPRERRLERLATVTASDNRISYGCINVPAVFFDTYVSPVFGATQAPIVYILPETRSLQEVFRSYDAGRDPGARVDVGPRDAG